MAKDAENEKESTDQKTSLLTFFTQKDGLLKLIVLIGIVGIALIFISSTADFGSGKTEGAADTEKIIEESSALQYREQLSEELGNMLASIDGVGRTKVMLTLDSTVRNIYATDNDYQQKETSTKGSSNENADKQSNEKKTCIVIRQKDGSEKALTVGQMMPSVKGVLVVCDGGDDENVRGRVMSAVSAALNISDSHICVTKMNS